MTKAKQKAEESGVELEKYVEESAYHLPSVVYELRRQRSGPAVVRIEQRLPDGMSPEEIGFHKEKGREHWRVREDGLVFETNLEGESEYETIIALRPDASGGIEKLADASHELTVEQAAEAAQSASDGWFTRGASSETQEAPEAPDQAGSENTPTEGGDPHSPDGVPPSGAQETEDQRSVADRLVSELKKGVVPEEKREYLQQEIGVQAAKSSSVDARISDLQSEIADLRAYTGALEEFLDENGSAQEVIDQFESRLASFKNELTAFESTLAKHDERLESMHESQQELESRIDSHSDQLHSVAEEMEDLSSDVDEIDEQLPEYGIGARISDIEDDVRDATEFVDSMRKAFES